MKTARFSSIRSAAAGAVILLVSTLLATAGPSPTHAAASTVSGDPGYWLVASDGGIYGFDAPVYGSKRGQALNKPVVGMASTSDGLGYWLVASDGGVFTYGDAGYYGSTGSRRLNAPIVGMAADPATGGYWLVASDGGIFNFNAPYLGSMGGSHLNQPVVGMAATPDGGGYWLVAADGGIFNFGDAQFYGSTGNRHLNQPVVGMAADPAGGGSGGGYWLVASDGGIFNFGDARFDGSTGGIKLNKPVTGMAATADGGGYWLVATDGGIFNFGSAGYLGSTGAAPGPAPVVGIASTDNGYPFPPGSTGYDVSAYQCNTTTNVCTLPPKSPVAIVEIAGDTNGFENTYYTQEAAWAGTSISSYVHMSVMPSPAPPESQPGPCGGNLACEAWHFGWYWAVHWVGESRSLGVSPNLWWLDVEYNGGWSTAAASHVENAQEISGAVQGLRDAGVAPGLYSTNLQWSDITGNTQDFPGISLWMAAPNGFSRAQSVCNGTDSSYYAPFAGGKIVLVQYAWNTYDEDYACPQ